MVPESHCETVKKAIFNAGAGTLGNYDSCSFSTKGIGSFRALELANPFVGEKGKIHLENECRIEVILPVWKKSDVEKALREAHPYEEPAYDFYEIENQSTHTGSGAIGNLTMPMTQLELIKLVKKTFSTPTARCSKLNPDIKIEKIAMCGGSGSFLIKKAISKGAQAFITSDTKYHDFVDYNQSVFIIDIGHFESEQCTKDIFYHIIREKFPNFALYYSELEKNPINYL